MQTYNLTGIDRAGSASAQRPVIARRLNIASSQGLSKTSLTRHTCLDQPSVVYYREVV